MAAIEAAAATANADRDSPAAFLPAWLATGWGVAALVALYRFAYTTAVAAASPALGMDNVADNVWAQQLRLVYQLRQPPLFEWLLWPVQRLTGPNALSFLIVKDVILTLAAYFLFGAARYAIKDRRLAALAVLSYGLYYNVGWTMLERLTQSSLLLCCCAATALAFARSLRTRRLLDHLLLGLALGAGLLAKFNFALFALALLGAAMMTPRLRARLRPFRLGFALAAAAVVISPYVWGLVAGDQPLARSAVNIMEGGARAPYLTRVGVGLGGLALSLFEFSLLLIPMALAVFWRPLSQGRLPGDDDAAEYARLFGRTSLLAAVFALVGVVATGSVYVRDWHVLPVFAVLPLWMFARIERGRATAWSLRLWAWLTGVVILCAAVSAVGALVPDRAYCGRCGQLKSYPELAKDLQGLGAGEATLVVLDPYTAGNLRAQLPAAKVVMPGFVAPAERAKTPGCFAVWETGREPTSLETALPASGYSAANLAGSGKDTFFTHYWPRQWLSGFGASTTWGVRPLDPQALVCR
jgi:4-amino-4-deoxy-L-arabinose transferase-like glycosyltransferase